MEKTIESLQRVLIGGNSKSILPLIGVRKRFDEFVERTRFAFSKHEEDAIVKNKLASLKNQLSQPGISLEEVEDCLLYAMYCETIGYSCSFAYIHSLKLAEQGNLHQKMIGYLAAVVFLHQHHELVVLLINTIQKDVKSSNVIEICLALNAICYLVSNEMVPAVQSLIEEKLNHPHALVRRSAILALQHCLTQSQNWHISLASLPRIEKALMDGDLSVVTAAVTVLKELIKKEPKKLVHLIPSLIQIQDQLIHRKVLKDFEYHTIPSPWLQIQILHMLAVLGKFDKENIAKIYHVVKETLQRAEVNQNVAYAITFECIETIINLQHDSDEILHVALSSVTKLLKSKCANLKFMGIKALSHVVTKVHPQFATQHQEIVMECLNHPDSSMRLQTLDLLYAMANPSNVQVICKKMLEYLEASYDTVTHQTIANRIAELAVQYCSDDAWFIMTTSSLFFVAPSSVPSKVLYQLIEKIKSGSDNMKSFAVQNYSELCGKPKLPFQLIQLASWIVGEMWLYSVEMDSCKAQDNLCNLLEKQDSSEETYLWILSALLKIILSAGSVSERVKPLVQNIAQNVKFRSVQQKAEEILRVVNSIYETLPLFAQQAEKKVDPTLSFLDSFVCEELEKGALPYKQQSIQRPTYFPCPSVSEKVTSSEQFQYFTHGSPISHSSPHSLIYSPSYHSLGSDNLSNESSFRLEQSLPKTVWTKEGRLQTQKDTIPSASSSSLNQPHSDEQIVTSEQEKLCKELFAGVADITVTNQGGTKENASFITDILQTLNTSSTSELPFTHNGDSRNREQECIIKSMDPSINVRTNVHSKQSGASLLAEFDNDFELAINKSESHHKNQDSVLMDDRSIITEDRTKDSN